MKTPKVSSQQPQAWQEPSAEDMLRFSQFAVDHGAEAIFWARPEGRFFYVNIEACRSLGYSREELLGMSVTDINSTFDERLYPTGHSSMTGSLRPWLAPSSYNRKLSIMLLDLSDFKQVNDTLGHEFGDEVLKAVSERLSSVVRASDTIARWGGDEFVLLVELKADDDAATIAGKLLTCLENPFCIDGKAVEVGASLGVAVYPSDATDSAGLIRCADIAMYQAKKRSKNVFSLYSHLNGG